VATVTHRHSGSSTSNALSYTTTAFSPAAGEVLVALVTVSGTTDNAPTMSDSEGGGWDLVQVGQRSSGADRNYAFVRDAAIVGSPSMTVTVTLPADAATGSNIGIAGVSGLAAAGAAAVVQTAVSSNEGAATTPFVTFGAACDAANPVLLLFGNTNNPAGVAPPSGFTEHVDIGYDTPSKGLEYASVNSGFTGPTATWASNSATVWGAIGVELEAAAGGGPIQPPRTYHQHRQRRAA
jgi:hypothetical protein